MQLARNFGPKIPTLAKYTLYLAKNMADVFLPVQMMFQVFNKLSKSQTPAVHSKGCHLNILESYFRNYQSNYWSSVLAC